ncbi:beta-ketoacyl-ACP synthase III [Silvibacterium dinghuense]|uniref:Beta-ketoacyl-[acyl-carrier-protein] synthase III n=1 Tax=Silvibacterium dinghuense TaxID=1560006 RepID=A0A4Q1SBR3_9BACT|nr:beta-ketoacyl-ACP synthase III [Silvibacterium dinghuense]RXS94457.1 ketoacyl-ACP synthase III [Silvibacterium dinghuense]
MSLTLAVRPPVARRAKISALGTYVPSRVLTNQDLEKLVETSDEWIYSRVGIRERHIVAEGEATSDMAVAAARKCLASRGIEPSEVDAIIVATVTPDMFFPATACLVQDKLGAAGAWGFDLSAACSGFVYALQMGTKLVESGAHSKVLVIGSDTMSSILDYTDRTTCVLFGDGAGAVLIEPAAEGEIGMIDFVHEIDGSGAPALNMPAGGSAHPSTVETVQNKMHYVHQDGQTVYKFAVRKMAETAEKVLTRNGVTVNEIAAFIPHQANKRIILSSAERLGLPLEKIVINIDRYGNTTAGTIPLAMGTAVEENRLKKGDLVLIASVGAGFTVGATLLRWEI